MRSLVCLAAFLALVSPVLAQGRVSLLEAVQVLPAGYRDGILRVSADNANPNPDSWYFVVQTGGARGTMRNVTVSVGQISSDRVTLGLRQMISNSSPLSLSRLQIDSPAAFAIARTRVQSSGATLGTVSYVLEQSGRDATPIWSIWCYARNGRYLGVMRIMGSDGSIISSDIGR